MGTQLVFSRRSDLSFVVVQDQLQQATAAYFRNKLAREAADSRGTDPRWKWHHKAPERAVC